MGAEQRKRPRIPITGPLLLSVRSERQVRGQAVDVSLLGFRFTAEEKLSMGDTIVTSLVFPSGRTQTVEGTIKSMSSSMPYHYGVVFAQSTTERIIREFIKLT